MNRRRALAGLAATLFLPRAHAAERAKRVVFVPTAGAARMNIRGDTGPKGVLEWIGAEFANRGLKPGREVVVEYVDLELVDRDMKALEERARAMLATAPDLVLVGEDGIEVLMPLTRTIPLVFYQFSGDPVALGIVRSFNHPGGNVTGTTASAPGSEVKGWELLRELAPGAKRLGVLWRKEDFGDPWAIADRERHKTIAPKLGFEYVPVVIARTSVVEPIERAIRAARVDVLDASAELDDPWIHDLMRFVERTKLPTLWVNRIRVREGGLAAVHGAAGESMQDAVAIAGRILRGAKPGDIPVAFPTRFITAINLQTARAMGLEVPPSVLVRASTVVK